MSKEIPVTFRSKLKEISENLEKCTIERQRRHSEFTKRIHEVVERHDKLMSGRLRRLSMEGIVVDIDSIRRNRRENTFDLLKEATEDISSNLKRSETAKNTREEFHSSTKPNESVKVFDNPQNPQETQDICQHAHYQLRLEVSFDSKNPTPQPQGVPRRIQRNRTYSKQSLNTADNKILRQKRLQRAFHKAVHMQRLTTLRRNHTVLSMVPIDIGQNSQLPDKTYHDKYVKETASTSCSFGRLNQRESTPAELADLSESREVHSSSGRYKFRRAMKKLESIRQFESLYESVRKGSA